MFLLLLVLLTSLTSGLYIRKNIDEKKAQEEATIVEEIPEVIIPDSYKGKINNKAKLDDDLLDVICNYYDAYFKNIYALEFVDVSDMFASEVDAAISNSAHKLLVETRKLYDYDFTMSNAYYDLSINEVYKDGNYTYVYLTEDDTFSFNFLEGIESKAYDIEVEFALVNISGEYKIDFVDKVQDYFVMFTNDKPTSISEVENRYNSLYKQVKTAIENQISLKNNTTLTNNITVSNPYNRDKAKAYIDKYCLNKNDDYYDYSDEGGNCQNYVSQCINAGGIEMDYSDSEWYYNYPLEYSSSWTSTYWFYEYITENENDGIVAISDNNLYYGQIGDVIQVGYDDEYRHSTIISDIVDGHILINSNSVDLTNYPIDAYVYPLKRLIIILGSN